MNHKLYVVLIFTLIISALCACGSNQAGDQYQPVTSFDPQRDAARDIQAAVKEAQRSGRRIILDVGGEWCIWCHRLDHFIKSNPEIHDFLDEHYVVVKINYSEENKNEAVLSVYPAIPGYPHLFVLDSDGRFLHSQGTAELEQDKSYSAEKMLSFLKEWASEN